MKDKTDWQLYSDDLDTLVQNTHSKDVFRLASARQNALRQTARPPSSVTWLVAATCCCMLAFVLINPRIEPAVVESPITAKKTFEPLANQELEALDDLDFYYWLDIYDAETIASAD